jgi:hypothetical protein
MTDEKMKQLREEFEIGLAMLTAMAIGEKTASKYSNLDMLYIKVCNEIREEVKQVEMPLDNEQIATDEVYYLADELADKIISKKQKEEE